MDIIINNQDSVGSEALSCDVYERMLPELKAFPAEEVTQINLDIPDSVSTVLGVLPKIKALREPMSKLPSDFDIAEVDKLEDYTTVVSHANTLHAIATQPPDDLQPVYHEALALREVLYADVTALIHRGLINEATIKGLNGPKGFKNTAQDLQILGSVLNQNWAKVQGNCGAKREELDRALKLALHILRAVGLREQAPAMIAEAADIRARAFTLFTRTYDSARRAVIYLRWHEGDADEIAPSLFAGRSNGRKKTDDNNAQSSTGKPATTANPSTTAGASPGSPTGTTVSTTATTTSATQPTTNPNVATKGPFVS